MKKLLSFALALSLMLCMIPAVSAADDESTRAAESLYELGLFKGTGTREDGTPIFDLDKAPTRNQAVIMLVRLLGKEEEALAGNWDLPFSDVAKDSTAYPYIGYAYANGLTNGTTATTYSGTNPIKANQYIAFVLRSLGYVSGEDFQVGTSWKLANEIGLTHGEYDGNPTEFTRGDVAKISYQSLSCEKYVNPFTSIPEETSRQKANFANMTAAWKRIGFPAYSKGLTLTWEKARALVGQDIETVKRYVKTIEDCLYYLCAADFTTGSGDLRYRAGNIEWHFNYAPEVIFAKNEGNCGGTAGFIAYLLEDDYDEVGFACYRSRVGDGGHVVNYVKDGPVYFVADINQFSGMANEVKFSRGINLSYSTNLNNAVETQFRIGLPEHMQGNHPAMMAYTYCNRYDGEEPTGWSENRNDAEKTYIIEGYSSNVNIVYETPEEGYVYEFISVDKSVLDKIASIRSKK